MVLSEIQIAMCKKHNAEYKPCMLSGIAGVAIDTVGLQPIQGVRLESEKGETGWYLWAGDFSDADDFFKPVHLEHIDNFFPEVKSYLGLGAGYKFIIDNEGYEDVWYEGCS
ncbi:immunity protein Imm33 domain-containing protein [Cobetia marina]|uniref:immunity protein Imm33 domain-containing protein n=1 Tax=Cobetia marina TaxID=28258 RepID=UPI00196B392D|nr:hypothetical protein [Cobetia marina]